MNRACQRVESQVKSPDNTTLLTTVNTVKSGRVALLHILAAATAKLLVSSAVFVVVTARQADLAESGGVVSSPV